MKSPKMKKKFLIVLSTVAAALLSVSVLVPLLAKDKVMEMEPIETEPETDYGIWGDDDEIAVEPAPAETEAAADVELVNVLANDQDGFKLAAGEANALRWETEANELIVVARAVSSGKINLYEKADASSSRIGEMLPLSAGRVDSRVEDPTGDWYHIVSGGVSGYARAAFFVSGNEAYELMKSAQIATDAQSVQVTLAVAEPVEGYVAPAETEPETEAVNTATITVTENGTGLRRKVRQDYVVPVYNSGQTGTSTQTPVSRPSTGHPPADVSWSTFASASPQRQALVNRALSFVGRPYVWGGNDPATGADCSGFTKYLYNEIGITLPRKSYMQAEVDARVAVADIRPGDLVFYAKNGKVYHVAMYIGDGRIVHAKNEESGITTDYIDGREYRAISLLP